MRKIDLVIIDPQNSFCKFVPQKEQQILHDGELCIPGAWESMAVRLPKMINRSKDFFNKIKLSKDSHTFNNVTSRHLYKNKFGENPDHFTVMKLNSFGNIIGYRFDVSSNTLVEIEEYFGVNKQIHKKIITYLGKLELSKSKHSHVIWPQHCLIGTPGHNVVEPLMESILNWEKSNLKSIEIHEKGKHEWTEHFSAIKSAVSVPRVPYNYKFFKFFRQMDEIVFAGEALSHCLSETIRDVIEHYKKYYYYGNQVKRFIEKFVILKDACDNVPGFEKQGEDFLKEMECLGMKVSTTTDYI